jgi:hypothetical protein
MSTLFVNNLNTASGSTITLPTGKRIVGTDNSSIVAPGLIVQIATGTTGVITRTASSSDSYVPTNVTATITPKFANSLIIPHYVVSANTNQSNGNNAGLVYTIYRSIAGGSFTDISTGGQGMGQLVNTYSRTHGEITAMRIDTPNTTSAVEYKIYFKRSASHSSIEIPATTTEHAGLVIYEVAQ